MRLGLRSVTAAALLTLCAMTAFLFSPRVPHGQEDMNCVSVMDFGPVHVHKNCDSEEFQYIAADPGLMLSARPMRQNRPLYAVLGWVFARPFRLLGLQSVGRHAIGVARQTYPRGPNPAAFFPEYAGFVTLNFILLLSAVLLFGRLSGGHWLFDPLTLLPLAMIVVNQVTKAAFWTPHLQIFNVLIPIASIALYRWMISEGRRLTWWRAGLLGLAIGIGALAYGAFAVMAAGAALCILIGDCSRAQRADLPSRAFRSGLLLLAFLTPTAGWTAFVIYRTGSFYSQEFDLFRQFVWILDSLRAGGFPLLLRDLAARSLSYADTLRVVAKLPLVGIAVLGGLLRAGKGLRETASADRTLLQAIALYATANLLFFWLLGYYESRLTWSIVPGMALLIAIESRGLNRVMNDRGKRVLRGASVVATVLYVAYWYIRPGPWG